MSTLDQARLTAALVSRAGGYLRNPVRQDRVTCAVCTTPVAGYERCYRCNGHRVYEGLAEATARRSLDGVLDLSAASGTPPEESECGDRATDKWVAAVSESTTSPSRQTRVARRSTACARCGRRNVGTPCVTCLMASLYTKNGRPLQRRGDDVFSRSGKHVGRIRSNKVYGPDGRYAGTIDGDRVVYRSSDSASISSPFARSASAGTASSNAVGSAVWGDEPDFPD